MYDKKSFNVESLLSTLHYPTFYQKHIPDFNANGKKEVLCLCPFHEDREPSLSINLESGLYNCFGGCGGGNAIQFIEKLYNVSFDEAVSKIKADEGITDIKMLPKTAKKASPSPTKKSSFLNIDQIRVLHRQLTKNKDILKTFMSKYGLNLKTIETFLIGYQNERFVIPIEVEPGKWIFKEHKGPQTTGAKASIYPPGIVKNDLPFVLICEGEFKSLLLNQLGFPAVSGERRGGYVESRVEYIFYGVECGPRF